SRTKLLPTHISFLSFLPHDKELKLSCCCLFILTSITDPKLDIPTYFFLHNLFFSDIVYTSMTIPKMLSVFLTEIKIISRTGLTGRALLTVMAFDWYIAICNPPAVHTIMTRQYCILLIFASWGFGAFMVLPTTIWATQLPYCRPNIVRHMFCSHFSVVSLSIYTTRNGFWSLTNALIAIYRIAFCKCTIAWKTTSKSVPSVA
uniref:Odorant receptor, family B, subfamily 101, member 1 n=1 Tax=Cyprinus carpio TaxID=7962 RepID=A0A8C2CAU2_CYPCA